MTAKIGILKNYSKPQRLSFPEDEKENEWLSWLLDSYFTADKGIFESVLREEKKGRTLACAKGCSTCCTTHVTIPLYPLEILGIYWYVILKVNGNKREKMKDQLNSFKSGNSCPFLVDGACGIHPLRPLACRHFNVFGKQCKEGEDPYYTRRHDVLTPNEKIKNKALSMMLQLNGISDRKERKEFVRSGKVHGLARNLQEVEWDKLALRMSQDEKG